MAAVTKATPIARGLDLLGAYSYHLHLCIDQLRRERLSQSWISLTSRQPLLSAILVVKIVGGHSDRFVTGK